MKKEHNCCCGDDNLENDNSCTDNKEEKCCEGHEDHNHEGCGHECECGVHERELPSQASEDTMMVTFDDGIEKECLVLAVVEIDEKEFIALLPMGQEEYFIYGYKEDEEGVELIAIESDEEFEKIGNVFEEIFGGDDE